MRCEDLVAAHASSHAPHLDQLGLLPISAPLGAVYPPALPGALTCTENKLQQKEEQKDSVLDAMKLLEFLDNDSSSWMAFPAIKECTGSGLPCITWDALRSSSDELSMAKPGEGDAPFTAAHGVREGQDGKL